MQQYQHEPLRDGEIRILTLQPGTTSQPLRLELSAVNFAHEIHYAAISYCWGDATLQTEISCNGRPLSITDSLHGALRCLRSETVTVAVWADAICINQQDISEKNIQIPLMSEIYKRASHVHIWLGEVDHGMRHVFRLAEKETSAWRLMLRYDVSYALGRILKQPWFRRIWVVQELAVSGERGRINYAPGRHVSWSKFITFANDFDRRGELGLHRFAIVLERVRTGYARSSSDANSLPPLLDLLHQFRDWEATDPRDKVYALLGLAKSDDIKRATPVDYSISPAELYTKIAVSHLRHSLRYLSFCASPKTPQKQQPLDLPSWVCDWSHTSWRIDDTSRLFIFDMDEFFGGAPAQQEAQRSSSLHSVQTSSDGQKLCMNGLIVDTIKSLGHPGDMEYYFDVPNEDFVRLDHFLRSRRIHTQVYLEAELIAHEAMRTTDKRPQEPLEDQLGHILLSRFQLSDPETSQQAFRDWYHNINPMRRILQAAHLTDPTSQGLANFKFWAIWCAYFATLKPVFAMTRWITGGPAPWVNEQRNLMFYRLLQGTARRRFATTDGGLLGSVPIKAQVGDSVLVCQGGLTPLVVRRNGECWEVIGDAYVRGLHDQEAVDAKFAGQYGEIWLK